MNTGKNYFMFFDLQVQNMQQKQGRSGQNTCEGECMTIQECPWLEKKIKKMQCSANSLEKKIWRVLKPLVS